MKAPLRTLVVTASLSAASASTSNAQDTVKSVVDNVIDSVMAEQGIPGVSVAIARNTASGTLQELYVEGRGVRDITTGVAVTPNTIFQVASITKQFTAALIMRIQEDLGYDFIEDPVAGWIFGSSWFGNSWTAFSPDITLRHLLQMTSGVADMPLIYTSVQASLRQIASGPEFFDPDDAMRYTNANYFVLGQVSKAATGLSFATNLQSYLLTPLGLSNTYLTWPPPGGKPYAKGHTWFLGVPGATVVAPAPTPRASLAAYGDLSTTARDLARWEHALMMGNAVDACSFQEMTTPPSGISDVDTGQPTTYGYGLRVEPYTTGHPIAAWMNGQTLILHNGLLTGARASEGVFPSLGLIIVVLTNQDWYSTDEFGVRILDALCGHPSLWVNCVGAAAPVPDCDD